MDTKIGFHDGKVATGNAVTLEQVADRLRQLLCEIADIPWSEITDSATVDGALQMQSVAFVELQVAIEDEYDIQVDPIRVVELNAFGAIATYIHEIVAAK